MLDVGLAVLVFVAAAALDFAYARYTRAIADAHGSPHRAARWSVAVYLVGLVGFVAVVERSLAYVLPECVGLYVGTWLAQRSSVIM